MGDKNFDAFKQTIERRVMQHPVVTSNEYTRWFASGDVSVDDVHADLDPGGTYQAVINGVVARGPDGVHITQGAVDDLIALAGAVDGMLQAQAASDTHYFVGICGRPVSPENVEKVRAGVLGAYRWQYIVSGVQDERFAGVLGALITPEQGARIGKALAPILG